MNEAELIAQIDGVIFAEKDLKQKLAELCRILNNFNPDFSWVGFYIMNHQQRLLHLGPYWGNDTEHRLIPFGRGICGQVADSGESYIAENVAEESNYIACNVDVKSEIVIPIFHGETLVAQLDIDSNVVNAFGEEEVSILNRVCDKINHHLSEGMHYAKFFG